jgi:hypothetical protein
MRHLTSKSNLSVPLRVRNRFDVYDQAAKAHAEPEADELTVARLTGAAGRHAPWREPTSAETATAVEELREIAGDRGDLLAEVAGLLIGFYRETKQERKAEAAARYCIAAGADPDLIPGGSRKARAGPPSTGSLRRPDRTDRSSLSEYNPNPVEPIPCPKRSM